jgi:two-component system phosphate regulon sensor histidine kinase PhoR
MNLLLRRVAAAVVALVGGAALGWILGSTLHWPMLGLVIGAATGSLIATVRDAWRGRRLMRWLRGPQEDPAPRDRGFWGELGYRVENALRLRERRIEQEQVRLAEFLSAIEASPNGVMMLDANEQIAWCNTQAADHFGIDPERDRMQRVTNLVREPAFVAHLQAGAFDEPVVFAVPGGRNTLSVLVRRYGEGMKLVMSQDITERERTDAMRRDFVANVSHEIRTPLTVLSGFLETLTSVPLTATERPRALAMMQQQTDRIQALVDDLLSLAQLEGSPLPATDRWVDIDALLARLHADAQVLSAGRHRIDLHALGGCRLAGVESELASAMANLIGNAVRYTPDGGEIAICWRLRESDGCAEFEVRDTGIGIAREHLPRLSERFYRVDSSRSRDTGGTGLGLAIVKHVVQRHGGELNIQSEPGKGSSFKLVFPAARAHRVAGGAAQPIDSVVASA